MNTKLQNFTNTLSNLFLLCLGLLAFQSIFGQSIFGFDLSSYEYGKIILNFISKIQYALVILAIVFGSLIFYVNRDKIDSLEEEEEKEEEEMEEEKRKKEFEEKFPRLSKIPVIGGIVRWFWKEGKKSLLIFITVIFFLLSTIPGLGKSVYTDEYHWLAYPNSIEKRTYPKELNGITPNQRIAGDIVYWDSYFKFNLDGLTVMPGSGVSTEITQILNYIHYKLTYGTKYFNWIDHFFWGRLGIILLNIIGAFIIFFILNHYKYKNVGYFVFIMLLTFPILQGFSKVVNHDSINGILLAIPILGLYLTLTKNFNKKISIISGIFFSLAVFTSGKSYWISPILFLIPIIYYLISDKKNIKKYYNLLINFFYYFIISFLITSIILFPAILKYQKLIIDVSFGFFFVPLFFLFLIYKLIYKYYYNINKIKKGMKIFLDILIKILSIGFIIYFINLSINKDIIYELYINNFLTPKLLKPINFINYSYLGFLSYSNIFFLFILFIVLIKIFFKKNKLEDYILIFLLLFLGISNLFMIFVSDTDWKHNVLSAKYLLVFYPIIIIFTILAIKNLINNKKIYYSLIILLIINIFFDIKKYGIVKDLFYINGITNKGILPHTSEWGSKVFKVAEYINQNNNEFSGKKIYNGSVNISYFLKDKTIKINEWYTRKRNTTLLNSDYFIIPYHLENQNPNFNKGVLYYYHKNVKPIWSIKINGEIIIGIWKNNKNLTKNILDKNKN